MPKYTLEHVCDLFSQLHPIHTFSLRVHLYSCLEGRGGKCVLAACSVQSIVLNRHVTVRVTVHIK